MKTLPLILVGAVIAGCSLPGADDGGIVHKSYALRNAPPDRVAQTLIAEERGTPEHRIVIVADPVANAVVVRGTPEDHVRLEKRIRELDVP
jgi:type II secretory pathway component GspD/PulD (secretin)